MQAFFDVCEKLRLQLATLMGNGGYRALSTRALVLARAEVPWLRAVNVGADGSWEGMDQLDNRLSPKELSEGRAVLVAQMLGLQVAFIGERLTLRLLREVWPDIPLKDLSFGNGGKDEQEK